MLTANQYQSGDYIISGCPNAFNNKTSYWISKKGNTDAYYCFSADNAAEIAEQLANFATYIALYETMHARLAEDTFTVPTPAGTLTVEAKNPTSDYPGIRIALGDNPNNLIACIESDPHGNRLLTRVYPPDKDKPVNIMIHNLPQKGGA